MLTQNSEMRRAGLYNWTLPAWVVRLPDGRAINVCPQAGACVKVCYALNGTYRFPKVKEAHRRNLLRTLDDLPAWTEDMVEELGRRRFQPKGEPRLPDLPRDHLSEHVVRLLDEGAAAVRIHDAGDFYSDAYTLAWLGIARRSPHVLLYAYTKEVARFRRLVEGRAPGNLLWVYSTGGKQDHLIGDSRHAEVFPDESDIEPAGYVSQEANDLLCVLAPSNRIGIPSNRIPHFRKLMAGRTFSQMEAQTTRHRSPVPSQQHPSRRSDP